MILSTIDVNRHDPTAWREWRDVCRTHARVLDMTAGMPEPEGRLLWAQPHPWRLVVRAAEPVTWDRLPAGWATDITHRPWQPPQPGRFRAVLLCSLTHQRSEQRPDGSRRNVRRWADPDEQVAMLRRWLGPAADPLHVELRDQRVRKGWHRNGYTVMHRLVTVGMSGIIRDAAMATQAVVDGVGRARAYGGGLSIWEKL